MNCTKRHIPVEENHQSSFTNCFASLCSAKYVPDKTYTFCGTPLYVAPEVVNFKGHDKGADHWSWAVLVYYMVTGKDTFYENGMDELALFKRICKGQFELLGYMTYEFRLLMISMLVPDPNRRLGSRAGGWKDIFRSPWFDEVDMRRLLKRELEAPWVPDLKNPLDSSKFDDCSKLEDKMQAKAATITKEQQKIFKTFGSVVHAAEF
jgi:serine/threonine protein kinase